MKRATILTAVVLSVLGAGMASAQAPAAAAPAQVEAKRTTQAEGDLKITLIDYAPRFLDFYAAARDEADADKRFALWKARYGFAAVPPGPQGDAIARQLLDDAWAKYPAALPTVEAGATAMRPDALSMLKKIAAVLQLEGPVDIRVLTYVGGFEGNAFTAGEKGKPLVAIPLEISPEEREPLFAHEMTHAVHMLTAGLSGGWERTIGMTVIQEGLAVHTAREVVPGRKLEAYIEHKPGWLAEASSRRDAILKGIAPHLAAKDGERVFQFTMGQGTTGTEREAYYTGYVVVERLRAKGMTLAQIARIPEADMPRVVSETIAEMLAD